MSRWSEEFEKHPIHEMLSQAITYLDTDIEDTNAALESERRRLHGVVSNLREIVAGLDPEFYPTQLLNQVHQHLSHQQFNQQLQAYSSSPQIKYLQAANDHITQFTPQIFHLAAMSRQIESQEVISNAQKAFSSFTASMETIAEQTQERFNKYESELAAVDEKAKLLSQTIDGLDTSTNTKLAEWQTEFTDKQASWAQQHSDGKIQRDNEFQELLAEQKSAGEAQQEEFTLEQGEKLQATLDHFKETGQDVLDDVRQKHEDVKEIHKLVGRDSVAGGYQTGAGDEKKQADLWRIVSLVCMGGTVVWLIIKYNSGFVPAEDGSINWPNVLVASSLTAILLYAAGYTSRQSRMHRDNEKLLRSYALETKALDPFIASLEKADQQAIKAELVRRMFGQQNVVQTGKQIKLDDGTVNTLVDRFSDTLAHAVKKFGDK